MEIIGNRKYVEIPGESTHELPPLLLRGSGEMAPLDEVMDMAAGIGRDEVLADDAPVQAFDSLADKRRLDLALNLAEHYLKLVADWRWGDSILEWIRQCEITFETQASL